MIRGLIRVALMGMAAYLVLCLVVVVVVAARGPSEAWCDSQPRATQVQYENCR